MWHICISDVTSSLVWPLPGTIPRFRDNWFKNQGYFTIKQNKTNILSSTIYLKTNKNINATRIECMRVIIWTNDARIIAKRPRMLSTQSVALYKTCKPKPRLSTHMCVTRPQWVKTEEDNELPIPWRFSNQIGILDIQSTRGILRFGVIFSKSLIYGGYLRFPKSWGRQNFNWFPIFTEFRV